MFYYTDGKNYMAYKTEHQEYTQITKEEFESKLNISLKKTDSEEKQMKIDMIKSELSSYDYIGIKIAMGVATKEDYIKEIEYTEILRQKIRDLEGE